MATPTPVEPTVTPEVTPPAPEATPAVLITPPAPDPNGLPTPPAPDGTQTSGRSGGQEPNTPQAPSAPVPSPSGPEPTAPGTTATTVPERQEVSDLPAWAQKVIKDTRDEAARTRVKAKEEAAAEAATAATKKVTEDIGRALGLITDDTPDEDKLTPDELKQLLQGERSTAQGARVELAVYKAAQAGGAFNAAALLDSRAFLDSVAGIDPTDAGALAEKIAAAIEANPWLKVEPAPTAPDGGTGGLTPPPAPGAPAPVVPQPPAPPSGGSFAGGPGSQPKDLASMSIDDFRQLRQSNNAHR